MPGTRRSPRPRTSRRTQPGQTRAVTRPGFGDEHPAVAPLLARLTPAAITHDDWNGLLIDVAVYITGSIELPPVVTCGARAIVLAGGGVLLCETPRDVHILPGGQLERGETVVEAACREVFEETGWRVDPANSEMLGFIHMRDVSPVPQDHRFPNPDFIHAVLVVHADAAEAPEGEWSDTEGWEVRSRLRPIDEVRTLVDAGQLALLEAALRSRREKAP